MPNGPPVTSATFALLLGAADWPDYPGLDKSDAFAGSAEAFLDYLGPNGLGLSANSVRNLFDSNSPVVEQLDEIRRFVTETIPATVAVFPEDGREVADILVYYIGHGDFVATDGGSEMYCVLPRCASSKPGHLPYTSLSIRSLFRIIAGCPVLLRKYLILDSCYAAGAMKALQSPRGKAIQKDVYESAKESFPDAGVALLCSSSQLDRSKVMPREGRTMFTGALLEVLTGSSKVAGAPGGDRWSLRQVGALTARLIDTKYQGDAVRPEVHSPVQRQGGDVADVALFPNPVRLSRPPAEPSEPRTEWCLVLSDWVGTSAGTPAALPLLGAMEDLPKMSHRALKILGRPSLAREPTGPHRGTASAVSWESLLAAVQDVARAELAVFDLSELEPVVLFLLGVRAVARRGVTICVHRKPHLDPGQSPFYLKELSLIPFEGRSREEVREQCRSRVALGFRLLQESPGRYRDLPGYDAVRWSPADPARRDFRPARQQLLLLGPYNDEYRGRNLPVLQERLVPEVEAVAPDDPRVPDDSPPKLVFPSEIPSAGLASQTVFEEIRFTDCCLVDWTGFLPNVFFELGIRTACNPIPPVCVIDDDSAPDRSPQKTAIAQLYNPIRYSLDPTSSADPFRNMSQLFFGRSRPNLVYSRVWAEVSPVDEVGLADVVQLLREAAEPYEPLREGGYPVPPVYPDHHPARARMSDAYLERLLAAWLYLDGRFGAAALREEQGRRWQEYRKLGRELLSRLSAEDEAVRQRIVEAMANPAPGIER